MNHIFIKYSNNFNETVIAGIVFLLRFTCLIQVGTYALRIKSKRLYCVIFSFTHSKENIHIVLQKQVPAVETEETKCQILNFVPNIDEWRGMYEEPTYAESRGLFLKMKYDETKNFNLFLSECRYNVRMAN